MFSRDLIKFLGARMLGASEAGKERVVAVLKGQAEEVGYKEKGVEFISTVLPKLAESWARSGLPAVEIGHKLAGMLADATTSPEAAKELRMPWPTFLIDVPRGFGLMVDWVLVSTTERGEIAYFGMSASTGKVSTATPYASLEQIAADVQEDDDSGWYSDARGGPDPKVRRAQVALVRLILSVIVELNRKSAQVRIAEGVPRANQISYKRGEPKVWRFQITRDVVLDVRPAVQAFIDGVKSRVVGIQTLVRGHYKRQPYGPKGELRRWVFIEAYWRGPEDAPIAARSHILT